MKLIKPTSAVQSAVYGGFGLIALGLALYWWLRPFFSGAITPNPTLIWLGPIDVRWYGLLMAVAVLVGIWIVSYLNRQYLKLPADPLLLVTTWTIVGGFIGARLLFVILKWPLYADQLSEVFQIHNGGMSIHGAIFGGLVGLIISSRLIGLNPWRIVDVMAIALPVGQVIGRFGNFFNQEAFGGPTSLPWKMFVSPEFRPTEFAQVQFFHPTFLYEAVGNLLIAIWLWWYFSKTIGKLPAGSIAAWYLLLYSGWRLMMEWFRVDSDRLGALTVAQWGSLALIFGAIGILLYLRKSYGRN